MWKNVKARLGHFTAIISLLLIGVLMFIPAAPVQAISSIGVQEWYLYSSSSPATGMIMTRTFGVASGSVDIAPEATQLWLADTPAVFDVTFTGGMWVVQLKTDTYWGDPDSSKCVMAVGEWNTANSTFVPFATSTVFNLVYDSGAHIIRFEFQLGSQKVHKLSYLALSIENQDGSTHTVYTDGESSLKSPDSDPGYPGTPINPSTKLSLTTSADTVLPGQTITLVVTENNTGDVPLTNPRVDLVGVPGGLDMLTKDSPSFTGIDIGDDGVLGLNEVWVWDISKTIDAQTTFTATGHGLDPFFNDVTVPNYPGEQKEVTVDTVPLLPATSNLSAGFLAGGLAGLMVLLISRRVRRS